MVCVCVCGVDVWVKKNTCLYYLLQLHVTFSLRLRLTRSFDVSVRLTFLVRETVEDNQERTNDVPGASRRATFDHARSADMLSCLHNGSDVQLYLQ